MNYFKNEEKKPFNQCSDEEKLCIINVDCRERYEDDSWEETWEVIHLNLAYRVLPPAPKPVTRDELWSLFSKAIYDGRFDSVTMDEIFERGLSDGK